MRVLVARLVPLDVHQRHRTVHGALHGDRRARFSFLLALPTLGAATLFEFWKDRHELMVPGMGLELGIGLVVSFFVAWAVIARIFLRYLRSTGDSPPFGVYRIILGVVVLFMLAH